MSHLVLSPGLVQFGGCIKNDRVYCHHMAAILYFPTFIYSPGYCRHSVFLTGCLLYAALLNGVPQISKEALSPPLVNVKVRMATTKPSCPA